MKTVPAVLAIAMTFAPQLAAADATLDEGRLDPAWFGAGLEFREADEIDYLWVAPGFSLEGRKLHFSPWPEPELLGPQAAKRDAKDHRLAKQLNVTMPELFADAFAAAFGDRIAVVEAGADLRVEGRIVDCSTGATAAKVLVGFGAGAGSTTVDLKVVDAETGELRVAIHHRAVSGTSFSTTDSKFARWAEEMAENAAERGFERLYAKGDRIKK